MYLRLLHGCPAGNDDLAIADHVTEELLDPPAPDDDTGPDDQGPAGPDPDDSPDDSGPDDTGPDGSGPDDTGPDGSGPDDSGPEGDGPGEPDANRGPSDSGGPSGGAPGDFTARSSATPATLPDLDAVTARHHADDNPGALSPGDDASAGDQAEPQSSPPPWQPGDPPPDPPPDDTADPTIPTGEPPPPLTARLTDRGLEFRPSTLRTSLLTVLGLARAHGRLPRRRPHRH